MTKKQLDKVRAKWHAKYDSAPKGKKVSFKEYRAKYEKKQAYEKARYQKLKEQHESYMKAHPTTKLTKFADFKKRQQASNKYYKLKAATEKWLNANSDEKLQKVASRLYENFGPVSQDEYLARIKKIRKIIDEYPTKTVEDIVKEFDAEESKKDIPGIFD